MFAPSTEEKAWDDFANVGGCIMKCPHSTERERKEEPHDSLASSVVSSHEIKSVFAERRDYLYWISLVITGDDAIAEQAMLNANELSASWSGVFRDWLVGWANDVTVRAAVRAVHDLISASAKRYADSSGKTSDDDVLSDVSSGVLSDDQISSLRQVDPRDIIAALDPLARSALVLRGIQHASIADCALLLDVPRQIVAAAYSEALRWNSERTGADLMVSGGAWTNLTPNT
jgi:DNA-directed RNA polymerase specialized sigma24 family protein